MGTESGVGTGTRTEREWKRDEGVQKVNKDRSGDEAGTGTGTRVETCGRKQDGNGDGSGDGNESSCGYGNGDKDGDGNGKEDRIGEGVREANKRKKPHKSCRRQVGNGRDLGGEKEKCREGKVGPVASNPENLENNKEARGGAQDIQGLSKNCTK